jgi:alpha-tubulin suppressor-like RCC1 family protein
VAATNIVINSGAPISVGSGSIVATACDENITIKALTELDAATGQLYVATIALSDISQNATTGCGQKIVELALKINGQMTYASWGIPPASSDGTFYFTAATSSLGNYNALTLLTPFKADGLTNIAIAQLGGWANRSISSRTYHTCALLSNGAVKCWGKNWYGQLGDYTVTTRHTPVDVSGLSSGVTAISAGSEHTCALFSTGAVKCWGANYGGQLGDNTTTQRFTPVDVSGLSSGVTAISVGYEFSCALFSTGAVKCWGANDNAELGDNSTTNRLTPVDVSGLSSGVTAISAGWYHTCALLGTGAVKCWGFNIYGQLGDGTETNRVTPVDVSGLSFGVTAISAGHKHTCAVLSSGAVKCWGDNSSGQLGDGTTTKRLTPVDVSGLSSGVTAISAGQNHTCALFSTGAVKCWGDNSSGQLGDGTTTQRLTPVDVSGLSSGVAQIATGDSTACALLGTGAVKCWGANGFGGRLGDGSTTNSSIPVAVLGIP